ncbi:hypothetical protein PGT21_015892 [Puccinia graminis f. sp. tritici]|uniref:Uncharacterized protein n=1 Tax=Puccinia graminis f. sp. tritici TaxID=56615 RepID=A0A5B0MTX4_PUCGR|nr:hypothetical protein PGT21_015892 [Puccinia graminis f. sp. tritici]
MENTFVSLERDCRGQRSRLYSSGRSKEDDDSLAERVNGSDDDDDDENESESRSTHLTRLKFLYLKAHQELGSIEAELEILGQAAQMSDLPSKKVQREEDDLSWRVERISTSADGPLVSPSGKVLRPVTILPSHSFATVASTNRIKLRAEVFRPDWTNNASWVTSCPAAAPSKLPKRLPPNALKSTLKRII